MQERKVRKEFDSYSWLDGKKSVKVYVDYVDASAVADHRTQLNWTDSTVEFIVNNEDVDLCLTIPALSQKISACSLQKKSDKFVLVLTKELESSWYALKKTA